MRVKSDGNADVSLTHDLKANAVDQTQIATIRGKLGPNRDVVEVRVNPGNLENRSQL